MNRTKKLTQGAMLLAIAGALMIIDRQLSYLFETILLLVYPVIVIVYSCMYTLKDGGVLCFGLIVMGFLFGSLITQMYMPLVMILGIGYSYGVHHNFSRQILSVTSMALFVLGEVLITFMIQPILGISVAQQLEELNTIMSSYVDSLGPAIAMIDLKQLMTVSFVFSIILMGIIEGFIVHLFSVMMLKRFRVRDIGSISLLEFRISKPVAYASFISLFAIFFAPRVQGNEALFYLLTTLYLTGSVILMFNGYLFTLVYGIVVLKRNITLFLILGVFLLFPFSLFLLIITGFLYGAGPLKDYIDSKLISRS